MKSKSIKKPLLPSNRFVKHLYSTEKGNVVAHILVGYCPQTLPFYRAMIAELKRTFPHAKEADVSLGRVVASRYVLGFTIIAWAGERKPDTDLAGWTVHDEFKPEHCW